MDVEPLQYAEISFATSSQSSSSCHTIPPQVHSGSRISFIASDQHQQYKVTPPPVRGGGHPQSSSEYARIEFTKSSRVSVLGGSPKFESTVWDMFNEPRFIFPLCLTFQEERETFMEGMKERRKVFLKGCHYLYRLKRQGLKRFNSFPFYFSMNKTKEKTWIEKNTKKGGFQRTSSM